ncbi:MAG: hypothetical protein EBU97_00400 [Rhodobacteraceae bacterium]|nr:hypothetical protein [Paracoccaceae bacterium]
MKKTLTAIALAVSLMSAGAVQAQTATNPAVVEQATASSVVSGALVPVLAAIILLGIVTSTSGGGKAAVCDGICPI